MSSSPCIVEVFEAGKLVSFGHGSQAKVYLTRDYGSLVITVTDEGGIVLDTVDEEGRPIDTACFLPDDSFDNEGRRAFPP